VWDALDPVDTQTHAAGNDSFRAWDDLQRRMQSCCLRVWVVVKDILCNDSPEGHLPDDVEEDVTLDTKDVLSYSFRAIHESRYDFSATYTLR